MGRATMRANAVTLALGGLLATLVPLATPVPIATAATTPAAEGAAGDTTFTIPAGARLVIENRSGDIEVAGIDGREAHMLVDGDPRGADVYRSGSVVRVSAGRRWADADLTLRVPRDVEIEIDGAEGDIVVRGFERGVTVETIEGDIDIEGAAAVSAHSVDGDLRIRDVRGPVSVNTGDGDTRLERVGGPISVQGIDGDITVTSARASEVMLSTVGGDVWYDGTVDPRGEYELATHDGDVTFAVPEGTGAQVSVFTWDGSLLPSFPIQLRGTLGSIAEFTLGSGSARVKLESFDGDIHLIRPGERSPGY